MSYVGLGSKVAVSVLDTTGLNDGNWTNVFDVSVLTAKVPFYEIYSISVINVPKISTVIAYVGTRIRTTALLAGNAEWDPQQPMYMTPDDELYLCWKVPATGTPITATVWMRYDPMIQPPGA